MLWTVPEVRHETTAFRRAVDLMDHLQAERLMWLHRLGAWPTPISQLFPTGISLHQLADKVAVTEDAWVRFLEDLDDEDLSQSLQWDGLTIEGTWRWTVEGILTQAHGHAWYHRGQIALLIEQLGGEAVETDFIAWDRPERMDLQRPVI